MKFQLCRDFGYPLIHPDLLDQALTHRQLQDWIDEYEIAPWGEPATDQRVAQLTWAVLNSAKFKKVFKLEECLMRWGPQELFRLTPEEYRAKREAVMARARAGL